jgi:uncharacterized membrane protein
MAVLAVVLVMLPNWFGWPVIFPILGAVMLVLAVTLVVVALAAARRMAVTVVLDDERLRVQGEGRTQSADWSDVVKVTRATGRITLHRRNGSRVALVLPRGGAGDLNALGVDIARRLDANRGYQS